MEKTNDELIRRLVAALSDQLDLATYRVVAHGALRYKRFVAPALELLSECEQLGFHPQVVNENRSATTN